MRNNKDLGLIENYWEKAFLRDIEKPEKPKPKPTR
jgi:hypothetical protein